MFSHTICLCLISLHWTLWILSLSWNSELSLAPWILWVFLFLPWEHALIQRKVLQNIPTLPWALKFILPPFPWCYPNLGRSDINAFLFYSLYDGTLGDHQARILTGWISAITSLSNKGFTETVDYGYNHKCLKSNLTRILSPVNKGV